jgi:ankyrin repeat protein
MLLGAGADPNQVGPGGWTPLMSAEGFNYKEPWGVSSHAIIDELLGMHVDVNARSKEGTTALLVAASHAGPDDDSFVKQLVEAGAEVNAADNDGETPLMAAAELGHVAKVRFLLAHDAHANARDNLGRTALDYGRLPRNKNDDDFPQCYESIDSYQRKTNDCKATRNALRSAVRSGRNQ